MKLLESDPELRKLVETKNKFFSIIAHDLKGPFNSILSFSELLVNKYDRLSEEKIKTYHRYIHEMSRQGYNLMENLLNWTIAMTINSVIKPEVVKLHDIIDDNFMYVHSIAQNKQIVLQKSILENSSVFADYNMLNTVIRNLLNNAIKFTPAGGNISVLVKNTGNGFVKIAISDTGVGIAKKDIDKLFDLDKRFSTIGTEKEKGTGIGLILCKEFIEQNGGEIWVESNTNEGTTFYFTLPETSVEQSYNNKVKPKDSPICNWSDKILLVVEDKEICFQLIHEILIETGIKVLHSYTAKDALKIFSTNKNIDIVLMDIYLSDSNGIELIRQFRKLNDKIPILAKTAYVDEKTKEKYAKAGCNDFISKPIDCKRLLKVIQKYLV